MGAADDQGRGLDFGRRPFQARRVDLALGLVADPHEGGVPVPAPAAVGALADVLAQAVEVGRALAQGVVGGDRVGDLVEVGEAVGVGGHEVADPVDALRLDLDHDVDQDGDQLGVLAGDDQRRDPAQRGADQHRRATERREEGDEVGGEGVERVVALGVPLAVAVAAGVERVGAVAGLGEPGGGAAP